MQPFFQTTRTKRRKLDVIYHSLRKSANKALGKSLLTIQPQEQVRLTQLAEEMQANATLDLGQEMHLVLFRNLADPNYSTVGAMMEALYGILPYNITSLDPFDCRHK